MQQISTTALLQAEFLSNMQPHSQNMIMTTNNKKSKKYAQPTATAPPPLKQQQQQISPPTQFQISKSYNVVSILKASTPNAQTQHLTHQQQQQQHHHQQQHQLQQQHQQQQQQQTYGSLINRQTMASTVAAVTGQQQQPASTTVICSNVNIVNNCPLTATSSGVELGAPAAAAALYNLSHKALQNVGNSNTLDGTNVGRFIPTANSNDICTGLTSSSSCSVSSSGSCAVGGSGGVGSGGGGASGIITLSNTHSGNALGITLGTTAGAAAYIHDKGIVGISVGCVDSRKFDYKNNNLLANTTSYSATQEYVSTGNNNSGNTRANQQSGNIYRGPPPPNVTPRGSAAGARHVHMQNMYQPAMHQNVVLPTYPQFTPRQPTFPSPQFQYTHAPIPAFYPYQYVPTLQQQPPQAHQQRSCVGMNVNAGVGVAVGNSLPVQTGPNGPLAGPGATQSQQQIPGLPGGAVITGAVQTGGNAVISVGSAGATPSLVSVMPGNVPTQTIQQQTTRKRHQHRLQIIDPTTNKNILDDLDKDNSNSESDYQQEQQQQQVSTNVMQPEVPQTDSTGLALTTGGGVVIMTAPPDTRTNLPYSIDVNLMPTQREILVGQTPVVSAMSDAPSVEILSTPQKQTRSKKIPIVPPKEDTKINATVITDDASQLQTHVNKKVTEVEVIESNTQTDLVKQQQQQKTAEKPPQTAVTAEVPRQAHYIAIAPRAGKTSKVETTTASSSSSIVEETQNTETLQAATLTTSTTEKAASNIAAAAVKADDNVVPNSGVVTMQITMPEAKANAAAAAFDNEQQQQLSSTVSAVTSDAVATAEPTPDRQLEKHEQIVVKYKSNTSSSVTNGNGINHHSDAVTTANDNIEKASCDETDRVAAAESKDVATNGTPNNGKVVVVDAVAAEIGAAVVEDSVQQEVTTPTTSLVADAKSNVESLEQTTTSTTVPATIQSLISYNEGQWSPNNPTGKKKYNRQQLMQLREAKFSRIQPEVNNASILPQTNLMPSFVRNNNNNHKRVQSMVGSIGGNRGSDGGAGAVNYNKQASMSGVQGRNSSMKGGGGGGGGGGGMIHVNLSLNQDVKLNETENAWRPSILANSDSEVDPAIRTKKELDELVRRVRGILNKLTPEKFDTLVEEIIKLKIDTIEKMDEVIVLVFEKAIDEPSFSVSYARLCHRLISEVKARDERMEIGTKSNLAHFRNALLDKTEREFTQNVSQSTAKEKQLQPIVDKIKNSTDANEKAELEALLEEEERKIRRRSGGTVRFIGELFKISMLTGKIIWSCIDTLLNPQSEDMLECLCKLLTTVGAKFEQTPVNSKDPNRCYSLEKSIAKMQAIASRTEKDSARVSSRVRFMLQDVIDLRKNKWQSTRNEAPKTMGQIEKETKNEQLSAQYLNYSGSISSSGSNSGGQVGGGGNKRGGEDRGGGGRYADGGGRSGYGGSHSQRVGNDGGNHLRRQQQTGGSGVSSHATGGGNDDHTWHIQTGKGSRSQAVDTNKLEGLLNQNMDTKKMGGVSQFIWSNYASRQASTTATTTPTNSFAALSSLLDKNSSDRDRNDRNDRDRSGPRNKGSYNKGSMERDRYNDRMLHSRTGSSQGSRENSTSRGVQSGPRGMMNSSSLQTKSASHSKYLQQMPTSRLSGKSSTTLPSSLGGGGGLYRNDQQQQQTNNSQTASAINSSIQTAAPTAAAVFVESTESDLKLIKSVISEMIELAAASKRVTPTVLSCIQRIPEAQRCGFLYYILTDYLHLAEVSKFYRRYLAIITANLIQQKQLSVEHFKLAYKEFAEFANDLIVDIPDLWLYIFQFTGPLIVKKIITVTDLWTKQLKDSSPTSMAKKFLKTYLTYCTREIGPSFTRTMWQKSNLNWNDFIPDKDVIDFIESNRLEYVENDGKQPTIELREANEKHIKSIIEHIEHLLKEDCNADSIIDYINGNIVDIDKQFIRSLTEALCNYAIVYNDSSYKLETELFQKVCVPVLQRYIDSREDRELECLYSMQLLVHSLEHPRGLLSELFGELYDGDVIPQDSFTKWRDSKDQSAGKGVAVKGLNPFFNHVLNGGETSDENN